MAARGDRAKSLQRQASWYANNREAHARNNRNAYLRRRFGITLDEYEELLRGQGGVCAICGNPQGPNVGSMDVDHCHDTGRIRGLLCRDCNSGIGKMKDSPELLRKAIDYLEKV